MTQARTIASRFVTFALGTIALFAGQMAALAALTAWYGRSIGQLPDFTGDGAAITLVIAASTPVQILLVVLFVLVSTWLIRKTHAAPTSVAYCATCPLDSGDRRRGRSVDIMKRGHPEGVSKAIGEPDEGPGHDPGGETLAHLVPA